MSEEKSVYLDIIRFSAALCVFLGHSSNMKLTAGFLWPFGIYQDAAVMIFFVLSGFVIAYITGHKETTLRDYTLSRLSRLYSVIIPALIITVCCDSIGMRLDESFYQMERWQFDDSNQWINYILSFFLLNNIWGLSLHPGINIPFWSLCYEFIYYCLFAALFFLRGPVRILSVVSLILLSGPTITILFPIWLIGYGSFKLQSKYVLNHKPKISTTLSLSALLALFILDPMLRNDVRLNTGIINRPTLLADYCDAILISIHLIFITPVLTALKPTLFRFSSIIRWLASLTFALYLFHRPLIQLFAVIGSDNPGSWETRFLVVGVTFLIIASLGHWCENQKHSLKRRLDHRFAKLGWPANKSGSQPLIY